MQTRVLSGGLILIFLCAAACPLPATASGSVTIYRDTYGVPHIYAETPEAAAYGLGYAQAEDRLSDLFTNVLIAIGRAAEFFGPEHVRTDYAMRLTRNEELCEKYWNEQAPPHIRSLGDSFHQGVMAYISEHPEKLPPHAIDFLPWHGAAIGRAMILNWPLGVLFDEYGDRPEKPSFASNGWAVSPARSADDCAILLTDPHLTWEGIALFYEARVHGGPLEMNGYFLVGSPLLALGHTQNVGWACTTGGPDTSDVFMVKLNPDNPSQYEYNGEWQTTRLRLFNIKVKDDKPKVMPAAFTMHGPLLGEPDMENHVAYAGKTPYMEDIGLFEQSWAMCMAKDANEFFEALRMNHLMEQNIIFADRAGNIGYARVGRTPIRPDGYDWSKPVPGHTSATEWLGIHDVSDLVHIMNPAQGYMQNCNISPAVMMVDSPLTPDKYRPYIYNVLWDKNNPRGKRATQLLDADESITRDEAKAIVMDVYDILAKPWQDALRAAVDARGTQRMADPAFSGAVEELLAWNGEYTKDSTAATLAWRWRTMSAEKKANVQAIADGQALSAEEQDALLDALAAALEDLQATYGKTAVPWGEIYRIGRGDGIFACDGADYGGGAIKTETLRDVEYKRDPDDRGKFIAHSGSFAAMLMFFHKDGVESYSCVPWGQNSDPANPHYTDQARELYSQRKLKPTWFTRSELQPHVKSEKVLQIP